MLKIYFEFELSNLHGDDRVIWLSFSSWQNMLTDPTVLGKHVFSSKHDCDRLGKL